MALAFGAWAGDRDLAKQGRAALAVSTVVSILAGALVAMLQRGELAFSDFETPALALALSLVIGVAAGLSRTDDGCRYLIGETQRFRSKISGRHSGST